MGLCRLRRRRRRERAVVDSKPRLHRRQVDDPSRSGRSVQLASGELLATAVDALVAAGAAGVGRVVDLLSPEVGSPPPARLLERLVAIAPRLEGGEVLRSRAVDDRTALAVIRCPDGGIVVVSLMTQPSDGRVIGLGVRPLPEARPWGERRPFVGAVWGTCSGGQDRIRCRGWRRLDPDEPVEETTAFRAGSIAKLVTAAGVLALASAGELGLEDPLWSHLPSDFRGPPGEVGPSVRHVLGHRGGFVDRPGDGDGQHRTRLAQASRLARPGPVHYGNVGYELLGVLLQHRTGTPATEWLTSHVLAPLGLAHSAFGHLEGEHRERPVDAALGYGVEEGFVFTAPVGCQVLPTAAGPSTTIGDLLSFGRWLALPEDAQCSSGRRLPARIALQLRSAEWAMLAPAGGTGVLSWGGSWPGFVAGLAIVPGTGAAGMLANTDGVDAPGQAVRVAEGGQLGAM